MARRRRLPDNVCADLVFVALREARPAGLTTRQLVAATDLSPSQVRRGLIGIKELMAAERLAPLIWTRRDGFRLSDDPAEWTAFARAQFHTELTRISRLISGTISPWAARHPEDEYIQLVLQQLGGVCAALHLLARHNR